MRGPRELLTRALFVQILRTLLATDQTEGWLRPLRDPRLGVALALMHRDPARAWTVAVPADAAGIAPLCYLSRLRMRLAGRMLRTSDRTVGSVAAHSGPRRRERSATPSNGSPDEPPATTAATRR